MLLCLDPSCMSNLDFYWFLLHCSPFVITLYLGFKFIEILADKIKICVEQNERDFIRYNLIDLIEEHNYFTKITADINKTFRIINFINL